MDLEDGFWPSKQQRWPDLKTSKKDKAINRLEAENRRLREKLQAIRDRLKFEANSDGGWAALIDDALTRHGQEGV